MNSTELYDLFRTDVRDVEAPYLWSDDEVWAYMNDAYNMFFRLTQGIADSLTDKVTLVSAIASTAYSDLHPSILNIRQAYRVADGAKVHIISPENLSGIMADDYGVVPTQLVQNDEGEVKFGVLGLDRGKIRWVMIPAVDQDIRLHVYRLPIVPITGEDQELTDLQDIHHFHLLKWMKALAYQKQDAETFDRQHSNENERAFRLYCDQANAEWNRYKHKPRLVAYGGI